MSGQVAGAAFLFVLMALSGCVTPPPADDNDEPSGENSGDSSPGDNQHDSDSGAADGSGESRIDYPDFEAVQTLASLLFIHGLDASPFHADPGHDYADWSAMLSFFAGRGFANSWKPGYYECDVGFTALVDIYGEHGRVIEGTHDGNGCVGGSTHDQNSGIGHLAYHLSWAIYDEFSSKGQCVNVVAHSMGGLITRTALSRVERGEADFPPYLCIRKVATLGTPHGGSDLAEWGCSEFLQCQQMTTGSQFVTNLFSTGFRPQGAGGTQWLAVGSYSDEAVTGVSSMRIDADYRVVYSSANPSPYGGTGIAHSDYMARTDEGGTAIVDFQPRGGTAQRSSTALWPLAAVSAFFNDRLGDIPGTQALTNGGPLLESADPPSGSYEVVAGQGFEVELECSDDSEGEKVYVAFYLGDHLLEIDEDLFGFSPSYTFVGLPEGDYTLKAECRDALVASPSASAIWSVAVSPPPPNRAPTLARVSPASTVSASTNQQVSFQARAEDADQDLDKTIFYVGGVQKATDDCYVDCWYDDASWTTSFASAGTYQVSARTFDVVGAQSNEVTWTVTVTQPQNHAPTISAVSPASNVNINVGQSVTFQARAEDQDSDLDETRFFIGGTQYGTDDCWSDCWYDDASWTYTFNTAGTYSVTAQARDVNGAVSGSASWTVTVAQSGNQAPTLSITSPSSPVSIYAGNSVTFRARAEDSDEDLDDTRFSLNGVYQSTDECWTDCWYDDASWTKTFYSAGTFTVSAQARDYNSATSNTVQWTVYVN